MTIPPQRSVAPHPRRTESAELDRAHYERAARRLRTERIQAWLDTGLGLFACAFQCIRRYARRAAARRELQALDGPARKDLGLGAGDLAALANEVFLNDPTRRQRTQTHSPETNHEGDIMTQPICWMNGSLTPTEDARISVFDHGLLYGDGVFEGIRFYHGHAFRLGAHLDRLFRSAAALRLSIPYDRAALTAAVEQTVCAFPQPDGYLRLVATRGAGRLGLDPASCARANVFIIADTLALVSATTRATGARLIVAATRRLAPDGLDPRIKSLNYLNHILARMEATNAGADEAILLNAQGRVAEGTADNIFIVRDGMLLTPPPADGALEGITRAVVLELAEQLQIPAREASLAPYDLYTADEAFLTGTGAELIPVRAVDGRTLTNCPGSIFQQIQHAFQARIAQETRRAA